MENYDLSNFLHELEDITVQKQAIILAHQKLSADAAKPSI